MREFPPLYGCEKTAYDRFSPEHKALLPAWLDIGGANPWIRKARDPRFGVESFWVCQDSDELCDRILRVNFRVDDVFVLGYALGSAFVLGDMCFINQVEGGDEWLTIKGRTPFNSITMWTRQETKSQARLRLEETIGRIRAATEEQCRRLEY